MMPRSLAPFLVALSVLTLAQAQPKNREIHKLYFFGNSFVARHSFPNRVKQFYQENWDDNEDERPRIGTPRHSPGGATVFTHNAYMAYDRNGLAPDFSLDEWGWVIIQDQSRTPSLPLYRNSYGNAAKQLANYAQIHDIPVMFMMTWGYRWGFNGNGVSYPGFKEMNAALFEGYQHYVEVSSSNGRQAYMAPCGLAFEVIYDDCVADGKDPVKDHDCLFRKLTEGDGSHPSAFGNTLCAMTMAVAMSGMSPYEMDYNPRGVEGAIVGGRNVQDVFRDAVYRTIKTTFESGLIKYPFDDLFPERSRDEIWLELASESPTYSPSYTPAPSPMPSMAPTDLPIIPVSTFMIGTNNEMRYWSDTFKRVFEDATDGSGQQIRLSRDLDSDPLSTKFYGSYINYTATDSYDWVIMNEDPKLLSSPGYQTPEFLNDMISDLDGATTMLLMPWAKKPDGRNFTKQTMTILDNTLKMVEAADRPLYVAPIGLAFEVVYFDDQTRFEQLYGGKRNTRFLSDTGRYLTVLTLVAAMTGIDPDYIGWRPDNMLESEADALQDAARRAIKFTIDENLFEYPWDTSEWEMTEMTD